MLSKRTLSPIAIALLAAAAASQGDMLWAKHTQLPSRAPVPEINRDASEPTPPAAPDIPLPQPKPREADTSPTLPPKPFQGPSPPPGWTKQPNPPATPDPRSANIAEDKMPADELACRERLKALGAEFSDRPPERDTALGCSVPYPLTLRKAGGSIEITPAAELNCAMAETLSRFLIDVVSPAAQAELGAAPISVAQASGYVCRPRNGSTKLSEHGFGNALDIASLTLADNTVVEVDGARPEKQARLLDRVRQAACGPFKTVLGPGSDADHAKHLHLDLAPRRNGGTFCQ